MCDFFFFFCIPCIFYCGDNGSDDEFGGFSQVHTCIYMCNIYAPLTGAIEWVNILYIFYTINKYIPILAMCVIYGMRIQISHSYIYLYMKIIKKS